METLNGADLGGRSILVREDREDRASFVFLMSLIFSLSLSLSYSHKLQSIGDS